ncbi:MAG: cellulose synthase subunit [Schlesneria sp.]|nr:cellulose synthase subunit [Schlesneria sp.]
MSAPTITAPKSPYRFVIHCLQALLAIDLVVCGVFCMNQMLRPQPPLPKMLDDDPLFAADLHKLARDARNGGSQQWLKVAQALVGHGHYDHALACYRHALELDPKNFDASFGLAFCLERTGHLDESSQHYQQLTELIDESGHLQTLGQFSIYDTGKNHLRAERAEEALKTFEQLPNFLPADYQRAKLLIRSGWIDAGLSLIRAPLQESPQSKEFRFLEYRAKIAKQLVDEARLSADLLERSQTTIRTNFAPDFIHSYRVLYGFDRIFEDYSKIFDTKNNDRMAAKLEELRPLVEHKQLPQYKAMLLNLAQVDLDRRLPEAVLKSVQQLHDFKVDNAHILWIEGTALDLQGQTEKAIPLWQRSVTMSPNASLHERLAKWFESKGDLPQCHQHRAQSHLLQARDCYRNNDLQAALLQINQAAKSAPDDADVWFYVGQINRAAGQDETAQQAYAKCISLDPNNSRAHQWIK